MPDWHESDHPRDEDGQFSSTGGGGRASLQATKIVNGTRVTASGKPLPAHIAALKIPPAWTDVRVSDDPASALMVSGRDTKGRPTAIYSPEHHARAASLKYARIHELMGKFDAIEAQNNAARKNPDTRDVADCLALVMSMGIRPGGEGDTGAAVKAYGATTLEGRHVKVSGDNVRLQFVGKKGVSLDLPVTDKGIAAMLKARKLVAGTRGRLFGETDAGRLLAHTHSMNGGGFKTKDFRTRLGTAMATMLVGVIDKPTDEKSYRRAVMQVAKEVSAQLGNTATVALQSYINPVVFAPWRDAA
jgi:DNA topoisomerase-1